MYIRACQSTRAVHAFMHPCDVILSRKCLELGAFEYAVYLCNEDCGSEGVSLSRVLFCELSSILVV